MASLSQGRTAAVQCGLFTRKSVPVIFEPPCTFKLVINWTNEILYHIVVSSGLPRPGIIDARARYRATARRLRDTALTVLPRPSRKGRLEAS